MANLTEKDIAEWYAEKCEELKNNEAAIRNLCEQVNVHIRQYNNIALKGIFPRFKPPKED